MATEIKGNYCGKLRCKLEHKGSGSIIYTDAPIDNHGKGENFSPTDLVAAGLGSCMLTIIGIRAQSKSIEIGTPFFTVKKSMRSNPRAINKLEVEICFDVAIEKGNRDYLEKEAKNCPVALSLSKELVQEVSFKYA